jgi:tetratricopeptide (TPR) repeat protein
MQLEGRDTWLLRYIEGDLSEQERQEIEGLLDRSPETREVLAEMVRLYGDAAFAGDRSRRTAGDASLDPPGGWEPTDTVVGRYHVESPIGSGSMGVVYLARDPVLDRMVALKLMHPQAHDQRGIMRLLREARALAQLSHPNVVEIYDAGEHDGAVFLAMELVRGTTLERWLHQKRRPWQAIIDAFVAAGRGLAAAHAAGLVHRDFKPANVLVRPDGRVVVTDFGLVRDAIETVALDDEDQVLPPRDDLDAVTEAGTILGTPAYMSPEQIAGRPVGSASDQFSFCVALYEALYEERPFHGRNLIELAQSIRQGVVPPPSRHRTIPRVLWRALAQGLRPTPGERWPSMTALVDALVELRQQRTRWPLLLAVAGVSVTAVAIGVAVFVTQQAGSGPALAEHGTTGTAGSELEPTRAEALRRRLHEVDALASAGRLSEARVLARVLLEQARALGSGPLEAEAQQVLARALQADGARDEALAAFEAAYWLAQSHGHDRVMAESATSLVGLLATDPQRLEEAETWARHAHAVIDRMGPAGSDVGKALADHVEVLAARRDVAGADAQGEPPPR